MALTHVKAGVKIEDTASPTTQWIRLADADGAGFAEAYPKASELNPDSIKYTSKGNQVAYLKGDIIKVPDIGQHLEVIFSFVQKLMYQGE